MSGLRAGEIAGRLLSGPYLISPDWLAGGRDAVPFATAATIEPVVAGRLAAAARACAVRLVLACPVTPSRAAEKAVPVQTEAVRIQSTVEGLGIPEALVALPDLSAALLVTGAGFAVAAGPRQFAETVAGFGVRTARSRFAEHALAARGPSTRLLAVAAHYGCALSGRSWRPAWLAWARADDVPYGSGIGGQLAAMRQIADGWIGAEEFTRMFRAARRQEIAAGERAAGPLAHALDTVLWALDGYIGPGGEQRAPGDVDTAGLRAAVTSALADV